MKNKRFYTVGVICLIAFIGIASYLWYLYFNEYEDRIVAQNKGLEFMRGVKFENSGPIYYVNASTSDTDDVIPKYYFRVENNTNKDYDYYLYFENSEGKDGCSEETRFQREDLQYELKLDNKVIKSGGLEEIQNNILDQNTIKKNSINDYSLKVWLKDTYEGSEQLHFHYKVLLREKK